MIDRLCKLIVDQHEGKKLAIPAAGQQVWWWFRELDSQRTGNGYGPNALGFQAIGEWARLRGLVLKQWQLDAILAMDLKRREIMAPKDELEAEKPKVSERPLTARLFDALFPSKK
ncbi:phage tail assembly chaperone [Sinorhizobium medicae]|uniref:phage tail assembly chaperone n=1 Tax=Sinorhizobium medicae TaxID=110321 RepID=UPI003C748224